MNISKLLVLPVLLVASVVSAEQARLHVRFNNDADKNLESVVELSDDLQVFINKDETRKVEFVKDGDTYRIEVSSKNEAGEWEVVGTTEVSAKDDGMRAQLDTTADVEVTLMKISE